MRNLFTAILLLNTLSVFCQQVDIQLLGRASVVGTNTINLPLGKIGNTLYYAKTQSNVLGLHFATDIVAVDGKTNSVSKEKIKIPKKLSTPKLQHIAIIQGRLYGFVLSYSDKEPVCELHRFEIDPITLKVIQGTQQMIAVQAAGLEKDYYCEFNFQPSPDGNLILVYYFIRDNKKGRMGYMVFDTDFKEQGGMDDVRFSAMSRSVVQSFGVSNNGSVYVHYHKYHDSNELKSTNLHRVSKYRKASLKYFANILNPIYQSGLIRIVDHEDPEELDLTIPGAAVHDFAFTFNENNDLVGFGIYANAGEVSVKGCFSILLDEDEKDVSGQIRKIELDRAFLYKGFTEAERDKRQENENKSNETDIYEYKIQLIPYSDGFYVLAEQILPFTSTQVIGLLGFIQDDIWVFSIDHKGVITMKDKIVKRQHAESGGHALCGYTCVTHQNELLIMYLKFKDNVAISLLPIECLRMAVISGEGVIQEKDLKIEGVKNSLINIKYTFWQQNDFGVTFANMSDVPISIRIR